MESLASFRKQVSQINENNFEGIALQVFRYQASANPIYNRFLDLMGINPEHVECLESIPFLPIRFFKTHAIRSGAWTPEVTFRSSGTTRTGNSEHGLDDVSFYHEHAAQIFQSMVMPLSGAHVLAVLPGYDDRPDSSLISMVAHFMKLSGSPCSGFCLNNRVELSRRLDLARKDGKPLILFGVTFALLDLVESGMDLSGVLVIETGGMKGRRKEIIRDELHEQLRQARPAGILSEYGMTELLSQAYSRDGGPFVAPHCLKIMIREVNDCLTPATGAGVVHVIDLANIHSCCFIETEDIGRIVPGGFQVLGRLDHSDLRGCNLLVV